MDRAAVSGTAGGGSNPPRGANYFREDGFKWVKLAGFSESY